MYCDDTYDLCCRYHGQVVRVIDKSGREHVGRVSKVTKDRVWFDSPYSRRPANYYGYDGYGYGGSYYGGLGFSIALGFITGIALAALFFI